MSVKCHVCMSTFLCTATVGKLKEHADNKHPAKALHDCFPHLKEENAS